MPMSQIEINTLVYQDEDSCWVAQGLEYDITTVARSLDQIPDRFAMKAIAEIAISAELGLEPLEGIKRAPEKFWDMYNASKMTLTATDTSPIELHDHIIPPKVISNMRVGKLAA